MNLLELYFGISSLVIGVSVLIFAKPIWVGACRFLRYSWSGDDDDFPMQMRRSVWKLFGVPIESLDESKPPKVVRILGVVLLIQALIYFILSALMRK
jgi:hypothetical protein